MAIIKLKSRVALLKEKDMEFDQDKYGTTTSIEPTWMWRTVAMDTCEVYKIIRYNSTKCIVKEYDGTQTLIDEPFDEVVDKWQTGKELDAQNTSGEYLPNFDGEVEYDEHEEEEE